MTNFLAIYSDNIVIFYIFATSTTTTTAKMRSLSEITKKTTYLKRSKTMKKYNLHKIMKAAHEIYRKYFKLYQLTHGVQTFGDCLKLAWANEKKRVADEEARKAEKEVMKAALVRPERRSSYDYCNAPASAYYNQNSKGAFGSRYVGD